MCILYNACNTSTLQHLMFWYSLQVQRHKVWLYVTSGMHSAWVNITIVWYLIQRNQTQMKALKL